MSNFELKLVKSGIVENVDKNINFFYRLLEPVDKFKGMKYTVFFYNVDAQDKENINFLTTCIKNIIIENNISIHHTVFFANTSKYDELAKEKDLSKYHTVSPIWNWDEKILKKISIGFLPSISASKK